MRYTVSTPRFMDGAGVVRIEAIHVAIGDSVKSGARLFDVAVDLGSSFQQNCPPISYFRIVAREAGFVTGLAAVLGETIETGEVLATFRPEDGAVVGDSAVRPMRVTVAGILWHANMWSADNPS